MPYSTRERQKPYDHLNRCKRKKKAFDKIQHLFMMKVLIKVGREAISLKTIKTYPLALIINPQPIKMQRHHFADQGPYGQSYDFSSSHVQM